MSERVFIRYYMSSDFLEKLVPATIVYDRIEVSRSMSFIVYSYAKGTNAAISQSIIAANS
jgi:hypothetical protein